MSKHGLEFASAQTAAAVAAARSAHTLFTQHKPTEPVFTLAEHPPLPDLPRTVTDSSSEDTLTTIVRRGLRELQQLWHSSQSRPVSLPPTTPARPLQAPIVTLMQRRAPQLSPARVRPPVTPSSLLALRAVASTPAALPAVSPSPLLHTLSTPPAAATAAVAATPAPAPYMTASSLVEDGTPGTMMTQSMSPSLGSIAPAAAAGATPATALRAPSIQPRKGPQLEKKRVRESGF